MSGTASAEVQALISDFRNPASPHRAIVMRIDDEAFVPHSSPSVPQTQDFEADVKPLQTKLSADEPAYIALRTASGDTALCIYSPDACHVKQRMLYAQFAKSMGSLVGAGCTLHVACHGDLAPAELAAALADKSSSSAAAQTASEVEKAKIAAQQTDFSVSTSATSAATGNGSVAFPMDQSAVDALRAISEKDPKTSAVAFLAVRKEGGKELLKATKAVEVSPSPEGDFLTKAAASEPKDEPRFAVYRFVHSWEDAPERPGVEAVAAGSGCAYVVVYVCPDAASVHNRMVHASARSAVVGEVESAITESGFEPEGVLAKGLGGRGRVSRVLETSEWEDVSDAFVHDALHPKGADTLASGAGASAAVKPKPKRAGRGGARLTS